MANDVIAAVATPPGRGGVGIVRVSGPHLGTILTALVKTKIEPRRATRVSFFDAQGLAIDQGMVLYFPAPNSYTGEDVIELHGHGGPIVMQLLLDRCLYLGARVAAPGEFTQRAYLNSKLDLAQAESVADLINASTAVAARCAVRSLQGDFSQRIGSLIEALIELRMRVEATLDFPEEDVETIEYTNSNTMLMRVTEELGQVLAASQQGSLLREGINVVLVGQPNVGKSSLLNRLAGTDLAIVTAIPGTTRDPIRESVHINGVPLHIIDTAGLREPQDEVEKHGISKTWEAISRASVVLWISDVTRPQTEVIDSLLEKRLPAGISHLHIVNKIDLTEAGASDSAKQKPGKIYLSAKSGAGIDILRAALLKAAGWRGNESEGLFMARARHLLAIRTAAKHLANAKECVAELELFAEELKLAQAALSDITGPFTADDLLGKIFSQFCIGK
jgi:tRNA modification GTPase